MKVKKTEFYLFIIYLIVGLFFLLGQQNFNFSKINEKILRFFTPQVVKTSTLESNLEEIVYLPRDCQDIILENERLRLILDLKESTSYKFKVARVIEKQSSSWFSFLMVDKGEKDGIKREQAVLAFNGQELGVLGKIMEVYPRESKVLLINDPLCEVPARLQSNRQEGIVSGRGEYFLEMKYLPVYTEIIIDDTIVTSGLSRIFSPGLKIGKVKKIISKDGLQKRVLVEPFLNFGQVEEVLILE